MKFFYKIILALTLVALASCSVPKTYNAEPKPSKLRIVDLQGNPRPVKMRTPELNVAALAAQGNLDEEKMATIQPPANATMQDAAKNKYATDNPPPSSNYPGASDEALQQTLQTPQSEENISQTEIVATSTVKKNKDQVIEYDLATDANDKSVKTKPAKVAHHQTSPAKHKGIYVQAGSFGVMQHAKNSVSKVKKLSGSSVIIEEVMLNDKMVYRVLIGPFTTKPKAEAMVKKLGRSGHQAIIVRNK